MRPGYLWAVWLLLGLLYVLPAWAQDTPTDPAEIERRGIELYENGAILYEEGRYEDAILAWQEGYRISQRPGFLFNIANAQERLGDYRAALDTLGRYRALAHTDERETLDRRIRNLEERLATQPAPVPVEPAPRPRGDKAMGEGPSLRPIAGISLVGLGGAGVITGGVFGAQSRAAGAQASEVCRETPSGLLCPASAAPALAANQRKALVADLGFGLGAAAATTGVVLLVLGGPDKPVSIAPVSTGFGGTGLRVTLVR
jgi:tetratricopeptide (TPR) repeat protein